jgi:hypothetical protein
VSAAVICDGGPAGRSSPAGVAVSGLLRAVILALPMVSGRSSGAARSVVAGDPLGGLRSGAVAGR